MVELYEEICETIFDKYLSPKWKIVANNKGLSDLQKAIFYLYFGVGIDEDSICQTLDIFQTDMSEILEEIYDKFLINPVLDEDIYSVLVDNVLSLMSYMPESSGTITKDDIPDRINIEILKSAYFHIESQIINYYAIQFDKSYQDKKSRTILNKQTKQFDLFISQNKFYFIHYFFPVAEHRCLQLGTSWNDIAIKIWQQCYLKSLDVLSSRERGHQIFSWLRYVSFSAICDLSKSAHIRDKTMANFQVRFANYSLEERSLFNEHDIESCIKYLSEKARSEGRKISNQHELWDYARLFSVCILNPEESNILQNILFKAVDIEFLSWGVNLIENYLIQMIVDQNNKQKLAAYEKSWSNLQFLLPNQYSFDIHKKLEHQHKITSVNSNLNKSENSISFSTIFNDVNKDEKVHLFRFFKVFKHKKLSFSRFKRFAKQFPFSRCINENTVNFKMDKVVIKHYTSNELKLSVASWLGGQSIPRHLHGQKYDAIYVHKGMLRQTEYKNNTNPIIKIIKAGEIIYLDKGVEHELSNCNSEKSAISVHLQVYNCQPSATDILEEYPNSDNTVAELSLV
jgi:uncharacterized RmlC-like cupin family protein